MNDKSRLSSESASRLWKLIRFLLTTSALFAVWLLFSFTWNIYSIIAGLAGSILISWLTYGVFIAEHEVSRSLFFLSPFRLAIFLFYIIYAMYASSLKMLPAVFSGKISPKIVHFKTRLRSDLARMILSNSITFTPGTITLDLNDDHLTVHWMFCNTHHSKVAGDAVKGRMETMLNRVWR